MASLEHSVAPPVGDHAATSTGLPSLKLAMWLFLASDCLLFGALISTYVLYRGASITGPFILRTTRLLKRQANRLASRSGLIHRQRHLKRFVPIVAGDRRRAVLADRRNELVHHRLIRV